MCRFTQRQLPKKLQNLLKITGLGSTDEAGKVLEDLEEINEKTGQKKNLKPSKTANKVMNPVHAKGKFKRVGRGYNT